MWAQGFGGPLGFGLLDDLAGNDHYYCRRTVSATPIPRRPGYEGWGQGVGAGLRQVGRRRHRRDPRRRRRRRLRVRLPLPRRRLLVRPGLRPRFRRQRPPPGCTRKAYDGGPRTEPQFQRFGCGWGCHYALGFCFDDAGRRRLRRHDHGHGLGLGLLGRRALRLRRQRPLRGHRRTAPKAPAPRRAWASSSTTTATTSTWATARLCLAEHLLSSRCPTAAATSASSIDYGGKDTYGCGAENNSYNHRGAEGGFLIDRPREEAAEAGRQQAAEEAKARPDSRRPAESIRQSPARVTFGSQGSTCMRSGRFPQALRGGCADRPCGAAAVVLAERSRSRPSRGDGGRSSEPQP